MLRVIKQIVLGLLLGVFLLLAFVFGYFYFNQDKIVQLLIDEVNNNVNTQIDVQKVNMSFWDRFPQVSIKFQEVTIHNATDFKLTTDKKLLTTSYIYFDLDLKTLFSDKPEINRITIGPGNLNLINGEKANYDILKLSNESEGGDFEVGNLEIENLNFSFYDEKLELKQSFIVSKADINATFGSQKNVFDARLVIQNPSFVPAEYDLFSEYGFVGEVIISNTEKIDWLGVVSFDELEIENKGNYNLTKGSLLLEANNFQLQQHIISSFLDKTRSAIKSNNSQIDVDKLTLSYQGANILAQVDYNLDANIDINEKLRSIDLKNIGSVSYANKDLSFKIKKFDALYKESKASYSGGFSAQSYTMNGTLSMHLQLEDFEEFLNKYKINEAKGIFDGTFQMIPKTADSKNKWFTFKRGEVGLTNISFNLIDNHLKLEDIQSLMFLSKDEILIEELKGIVNKNDVEFSGKAEGLQDYMFAKGKLTISGDVKSNEFYLSDFLYASPESKTGTIQLGEKLDLVLDVLVKDIRNNNFRGENLSLKLEKNGHEVKLKNFDITTSEGHLSGQGVFLEQQNGDWYTTLSANIQQIEIGEFFLQMNEFGQTYIVSDNLKGRLNADINADFVFNPQFKVRTESIYLDADIEITDGELINYKMLEELSDFIDVDELKHVKFEKLKNRISIHDNKIIIPQMQVHSSAIDLGLVGEHGFNDIIDYQISVGLADVLFGKIPRKLRKESKRRKNKKLTLFVDITGNINDPEVSLSKISREKVIDEQQIEKKKKKFEIEFDDF